MHDEPLSDEVLDKLEEAERLKLMGKYEEAISLLETILSSDPENVSALEEIADNELSLERYDRASHAAKRCIDLDDKSYSGYYILGFIHSHNEKWDEAIAYLQKANKIKSNNSEILRCLGWALFNNKQRAQGTVTLERALNLDEDNSLTLCDLGVAYLQMRNFPKAKMLFTHAVDIDNDNTRAKECLQAVERLERAMHDNSVKGEQ